jgi:hypothetical protein
MPSTPRSPSTHNIAELLSRQLAQLQRQPSEGKARRRG